MSVQFGAQCFADSAGAAAAFAAAEIGSVYSAGARVWTVTAATPSGGSVALELTDLASADPPLAVTVAPVFNPCSLLDWQDGLQLGWGIAAAWIFVAALGLMARSRKASA